MNQYMHTKLTQELGHLHNQLKKHEQLHGVGDLIHLALSEDKCERTIHSDRWQILKDINKVTECLEKLEGGEWYMVEETCEITFDTDTSYVFNHTTHSY